MYKQKKAAIDSALKGNLTELDKNATEAKARINEWLESELSKLRGNEVRADGEL